MSDLALVVWVVVGIFTLLWVVVDFEECPGEYRGYKCRNDSCDHSDKAWRDIGIIKIR